MMNKYILFFLLLLPTFYLHSQVSSGGGSYNIEQSACLSDEQRADIIYKLQEIHKESKQLQEFAKLESKMTSFTFPVRASESFDNNKFYGISNYVDHNSVSSGENNTNVRDYNCGNRSYDLGSGYDHRGTDIFTWPFAWKKMDEDQAEVIAADEGMIIYRSEGNYDRNCSFCTNCQWNAIYLQHANGNVSWYGHLKESSVTEKNTGDIVEKGEYLGVIGSSGSSTGPHLHFEIWEDNSYTNLLDPYEGVCNMLNEDSMWDEQEEYKVPSIMELTTSTSNPMPQGCGEQWITNLSNQFVPGEQIFFSAYFRDQLENESADHRVYDASGTLVDLWIQQFDNDFNASWWWFNRTYSNDFEQGMWTYEIEYLDDVKQHLFQVGQLSNEEDVFQERFEFRNNSFGGTLHLINKSNTRNSLACSIINSQGQLVYNNKLVEVLIINSDNLSPGIYFLHLVDPVSKILYTKRFLIL